MKYNKKLIYQSLGSIILLGFLFLTLFVMIFHPFRTESDFKNVSVNGYMYTTSSRYWENQGMKIIIYKLPVNTSYALITPRQELITFNTSRPPNNIQAVFTVLLPYKEEGIEFYYFILLEYYGNSTYYWRDCLAIQLMEPS